MKHVGHASSHNCSRRDLPKPLFPSSQIGKLNQSHLPPPFSPSASPSRPSKARMATSLSTDTAIFHPIPSHAVPRSLSPCPRPPSRSERLLRETLERDSSTRLYLQQPPSSSFPPLMPRAFSPEYDCALESDDDDVNIANDPWLENPVRHRRSSSRPKSPSIIRPIPKLHRIQTSPPASPRPSHSRSRSHSHQPGGSRAVAIPRSRTPAPANSAQNYFTPPSSSYSFFSSFKPSSLSNDNSVARASLERALHRDRVKWVQHEPDRHSTGGPYRSSRRVSVPRHNSKESDETSYNDPLTPPPSPPFNAQTASRLCKDIEGVVHFSDIEGLGAPPGLTEEELEELQNKAQKDRFALFSTWLGLSPSKDRENRSYVSGIY